MTNYIEEFKNIKFRPCELVTIRTIAEEYRKRLFEKYNVKDQKELRKYWVNHFSRGIATT